MNKPMKSARAAGVLLVALVAGTGVAATVTLRPASHLQFPHATDSNSPGHWDGSRLYLFNSTGHPYRSDGSNIFHLGNTAAVTVNNNVNGGRWGGATRRATDGTADGSHANRPGRLCP